MFEKNRPEHFQSEEAVHQEPLPRGQERNSQR
jgi:hypothetical protein